MIAPLIKGLQITFGHLFKKSVTLQYPEEKPNVAPNFRGLHTLKVSHNNAKCVACYLCPTVCPAKCITVETAENAKGEKYPKVYKIDLLRCIFCGYCVEACPVEALEMTGAYELANYKRADFEFTKERLLK